MTAVYRDEEAQRLRGGSNTEKAIFMAMFA